MVLDGRARMVAMSRRERRVAHDITDAPFLFAVMVRRRTFFLRGSFDCTFHVVAERLAIRRSRGEALFRGGSFHRSGAGLELHEEWKRHRGVELSNTDRIRAA